MTKQELYLFSEKIFLEQLGLKLSEAVSFDNEKYILHIEQIGLSMASLQLNLSNEEHGYMHDFLEFVRKDNNPLEQFEKKTNTSNEKTKNTIKQKPIQKKATVEEILDIKNLLHIDLLDNLIDNYQDPLEKTLSQLKELLEKNIDIDEKDCVLDLSFVPILSNISLDFDVLSAWFNDWLTLFKNKVNDLEHNDNMNIVLKMEFQSDLLFFSDQLSLFNSNLNSFKKNYEQEIKDFNSELEYVQKSEYKCLHDLIEKLSNIVQLIHFIYKNVNILINCCKLDLSQKCIILFIKTGHKELEDVANSDLVRFKYRDYLPTISKDYDD